jgi:macrolide transport system ATP-binding/permease protein
VNSTGILPPLTIRGLDTANCATAEAGAGATTDADADADTDSDAEAAADGLAVADAATAADVEGDGAPGLGDVAALQPASRTHASPMARSGAIDRSVTA